MLFCFSGSRWGARLIKILSELNAVLYPKRHPFCWLYFYPTKAPGPTGVPPYAVAVAPNSFHKQKQYLSVTRRKHSTHRILAPFLRLYTFFNFIQNTLNEKYKSSKSSQVQTRTDPRIKKGVGRALPPFLPQITSESITAWFPGCPFLYAALDALPPFQGTPTASPAEADEVRNPDRNILVVQLLICM